MTEALKLTYGMQNTIGTVLNNSDVIIMAEKELFIETCGLYFLSVVSYLTSILFKLII